MTETQRCGYCKATIRYSIQIRSHSEIIKNNNYERDITDNTYYIISAIKLQS